MPTASVTGLRRYVSSQRTIFQSRSRPRPPSPRPRSATEMALVPRLPRQGLEEPVDEAPLSLRLPELLFKRHRALVTPRLAQRPEQALVSVERHLQPPEERGRINSSAVTDTGQQPQKSRCFGGARVFVRGGASFTNQPIGA
ncbi:hypothetical protein DL765_007720 [Monosporascus sp. GIB2]|nr:hypothetical protein DL765_007720 [Monosporascus sp. GIB2]